MKFLKSFSFNYLKKLWYWDVEFLYNYLLYTDVEFLYNYLLYTDNKISVKIRQISDLLESQSYLI